MEVDELEKIKLGLSLELEAFIESLERMPMEFGEGCSHVEDIIRSRLALGVSSEYNSSDKRD